MHGTCRRNLLRNRSSQKVRWYRAWQAFKQRLEETAEQEIVPNVTLGYQIKVRTILRDDMGISLNNARLQAKPGRNLIYRRIVAEQ